MSDLLTIAGNTYSSRLLIGTGKTMHFLAPDLRASLSACGLVADAMDTGAACRTFNVLLAEDRIVMAALIAVD